MRKGFFVKVSEVNHESLFYDISWNINSHNFQNFEKAKVLLNLSIKEMDCAFLNTSVNSIPIVGFINSNLWENGFSYNFDDKKKIINQFDLIIKDPYTYDVKDQLELIQSSISFETLDSENIGDNEDEYWKSIDSFLGGNKFIRVLGNPLWVNDPIQSMRCNCNKVTDYICSIGYEISESSKFVKTGCFFIGECAKYYFLCAHCKKIYMIPQYS